MKKITLCLLFSLLFTNGIYATVQCSDTLIVGEEKYLLDQTIAPIIADYCKSEGINYPFTYPHTALYRGVIATWKIEDGLLYLQSVNEYYTSNSAKDTIDNFIQKLKAKPFVQYTGLLEAKKSKYAEDLYCFQIEDGKLVGSSSCDGINCCEGYKRGLEGGWINKIGGMTFCRPTGGSPLFLMKKKSEVYRCLNKCKARDFTVTWKEADGRIYLEDVEIHDKEGNLKMGSDVGLNRKMEHATSLNGLFFAGGHSRFLKMGIVLLDYTLIVYNVENGVIKEKFEIKKEDKKIDERLQKLFNQYNMKCMTIREYFQMIRSSYEK